MISKIRPDTLLELDETVTAPPSNKTNRKGSLRREAHSIKFKTEVIEEYKSGITQDKVAAKYKINRSLVSKWFKQKEKIIAMSTKELNNFKKIKADTRYNNLYSALFLEFKTARSKGYRVDFNWIWSKARGIYRKQTDNPEAYLKTHVITSFLDKFNIRLRAKQEKTSKDSSQEDLKTVDTALICLGGNENHEHCKADPFRPESRRSVESPCSVKSHCSVDFVVNVTKKTNDSDGLELREDHDEGGGDEEEEVEVEEQNRDPECEEQVKILEDRECDRSFDEPLVGSMLGAIYDTGYFTGEITYYNTHLKEYRVNFADGSSDYVKYEDIDGVDMFIVPS